MESCRRDFCQARRNFLGVLHFQLERLVLCMCLGSLLLEGPLYSAPDFLCVCAGVILGCDTNLQLRLQSLPSPPLPGLSRPPLFAVCLRCIAVVLSCLLLIEMGTISDCLCK